MASPAELRAKLLAQRATQQQEAKRKDEIHESAKLATKDMVMLGYNFNDILELVKTEVTEEYLNDIFRSIGILRKRKHSQKRALGAFGASRWLDYQEDFVIDLDGESSDEEASLDDIEPHDNTDGAASSPASQEDAENAVMDEGLIKDSLKASKEMSAESYEDLAHKDEIQTHEDPRDHIERERASSGTSVAPNNDHEMSGLPMEQMNAEMHGQDAGPTHPETTDVRVDNAQTSMEASQNFVHNGQQGTEPRPQSSSSIYSSWEPSWATDASHAEDVDMADTKMANADTADADMADADIADADIADAEVPEPPNEAFAESSSDSKMEAEEAIEATDASRPPDSPVESHSPEVINSAASPGTPHSENSPDMHSPDSPEPKPLVPDDDAVQRELTKVQDQIREMQKLKLAREAQREAVADMNRRNMELRDIASKRALLIQKRGTLDVAKVAKNVEDLERKLEHARQRMYKTRHDLAELDREALVLETQELKLREELSRPRPVVTKDAKEPVHAQASRQADTEDKPHAEQGLGHDYKYPVPTAATSPLRAFSSFRMCPSLGQGHWFSKSFNGHFIKDLSSRELCPDELRGRAHKASRRDCAYVHFSDFDVSPLDICEYMASRQVDRPGYREGLVEALQTHLPATTTPSYIAASIIGYSRKYDPTQILDWDAWDVQRPM